MAWTDSNDNKNVLIASVFGELNPQTGLIDSFTIYKSTSAKLKCLINVLLTDIKNDSAAINFIENDSDSQKMFIRIRSDRFIVNFYVAKEDVDKIGTDATIKLLVNTDVFPNNKQSFIKFFEDFRTILGWKNY